MHEPKLLLDAVGFAARAHQHQVRKDLQTPYISHPFRVALIVSQVFRIDDPLILTAAMLHDTIEDTTTDYDDLAERFGEEVASWVAFLTKDMRLPEDRREVDYLNRLAQAPWQVCICKLSDIYDNLCDSAHLKADARHRTILRSQKYLDAIRLTLHDLAKRSFEIVEQKLEEVKQSQT